MSKTIHCCIVLPHSSASVEYFGKLSDFLLGFVMTIRNVSEKILHGLSIRTDNETEMSADKGKIGALWQQFDKVVDVDYQSGERVYGVYFDYESDARGQFSVLAGFDGKNLPASIPLQKVVISAGKYLVFKHKGEMPQIAIDGWTEVWNYFSNPEAKHQRAYSTDFEFYPNYNEIEIHIAIK